jgi:hypothetical protein
MGTVEILAILAIPSLILWVTYRRNRKRVKAERSTLLDSCLGLFSEYKVTQQDVYYPVLEGMYEGHSIKLEPISDDIAFRTLPSLWLLITVRGSIPYKGIFDFLVRPRDNIETYSPSAELNTKLRIPNGWPTHAVLRTNDRWQMPPEEVVTPHMSLFEDGKTKELSIGPGGIRLVYQIGVANIAYYKLFRQVKFEEITLGPEMLRALLDRLLALYHDLTVKQDRGKKEA